MAQVYVSIGSNIERRRHIGRALAALAERYGPVNRSHVYESDAVGFDSDPFFNLVVGFDTVVPPLKLQEQLHAIEADCGRVRTTDLKARTLDLDLLLYASQVITGDGLTLPRDDIERYAFVLGPLAELAPEYLHPVTGQRVADMWANFDTAAQPMTRVDWTGDD